MSDDILPMNDDAVTVDIITTDPINDRIYTVNYGVLCDIGSTVGESFSYASKVWGIISQDGGFNKVDRPILESLGEKVADLESVFMDVLPLRDELFNGENVQDDQFGFATASYPWSQHHDINWQILYEQLQHTSFDVSSLQLRTLQGFLIEAQAVLNDEEHVAMSGHFQLDDIRELDNFADISSDIRMTTSVLKNVLTEQSLMYDPDMMNTINHTPIRPIDNTDQHIL